jgi:hypothetical protein
MANMALQLKGKFKNSMYVFGGGSFSYDSGGSENNGWYPSPSLIEPMCLYLQLGYGLEFEHFDVEFCVNYSPTNIHLNNDYEEYWSWNNTIEAIYSNFFTLNFIFN